MSENSLPNLILPGYAILKLGRLHPENVTQKGFLQKLVLLFYLLPLFWNIFMSWEQMIYFSNNSNEFATNLLAVAAFIQILVKTITCIIYRKELLDLLNETYNFWDLSTLSDQNLKSRVYKQHSKTYKVINGFLMFALLAIIAAALSPNLLEKELPVGAYSYSGSYSSYLLYYFTQDLAVICAGITVPTLEVIYIGACTMVATQFKIAASYLKSIKHDDDGQNYMKNVKTFVEYHNRLFRTVDKIKAIYSLTLLTQYLTGISLLCGEMYMMSEGTDFRFNASLEFFYVTMQCGIYCAWADHLSTEAAAVADVVYDSNWGEGYLPQQRKSLVIIIARSQMPVAISAYGLVDVNLNTFTKILKVSWSFFSILRAMKSN